MPTYRTRLEMLIAELGPYSRALLEEDRRAFDALMNRARGYASAAGYLAAADPLDTAFLSMLVGLERELGALRERVTGVLAREHGHPVTDAAKEETRRMGGGEGSGGGVSP
ncbi:MAG: hypothetical protein QXW06_05460 [Thermoplasmata archaeon]